MFGYGFITGVVAYWVLQNYGKKILDLVKNWVVKKGF